MRAFVVALIVLLAGCTSSSTSDTEAPLTDGQADSFDRASPDEAALEQLVISHDLVNATWNNDTQVELRSGSVKWHGDLTTGLNAYNQVTQPIAHPCSYGGSYYFNNQPVTDFVVPYGTGQIGIIFDWDETDYLRDALRVAYFSPWNSAWTDSQPFGKGEQLLLDVHPYDWKVPNSTATAARWTIVACMDTDTGASVVPPSMFYGTLDYEITAHRMDDATISQFKAQLD